MNSSQMRTNIDTSLSRMCLITYQKAINTVLPNNIFISDRNGQRREYSSSLE